MFPGQGGGVIIYSKVVAVKKIEEPDWNRNHGRTVDEPGTRVIENVQF